MTTKKGAWNLQDVRDKLLAGDPWLRYNNLYTAGTSSDGQSGQNRHSCNKKICMESMQEKFHGPWNNL